MIYTYACRNFVFVQSLYIVSCLSCYFFFFCKSHLLYEMTSFLISNHTEKLIKVRRYEVQIKAKRVKKNSKLTKIKNNYYRSSMINQKILHVHTFTQFYIYVTYTYYMFVLIILCIYIGEEHETLIKLMILLFIILYGVYEI